MVNESHHTSNERPASRPVPPPRAASATLHRNAPLSPEGRGRLVERCRTRPIAHVAAEMGIFRATASKWVNRHRRFGDLGLLDRPSTPHRQPSALGSAIVAQIEQTRRTHKWSALRITFELQADGVTISRRTVTRHLAALGLNHRRFIDPNGDTDREPRKITARRPGHMVHIDVKKVGRIPDGGGWRVHGRGSDAAKATERTKTKTKRGGYVYLHSAIDGFSRLAYIEALPDEKAVTAIAFMHSARAWFTAHGIVRIERIVTDNGACYRADAFARALLGHDTSGSRRTRPATTGRWSATTGSSPRSSSTPALDLRGAAPRSPRGLEHPLQLPPAAQRRRRPPSVPTADRRQQRHGLLQPVPATTCCPPGRRPRAPCRERPPSAASAFSRAPPRGLTRHATPRAAADAQKDRPAARRSPRWYGTPAAAISDR